MIKNEKKLNNFYQGLIREEKLSYKEALRIYEMLLKEAISLGVISSKTMKESLEVDIKVAKIINSLSW